MARQKGGGVRLISGQVLGTIHRLFIIIAKLVRREGLWSHKGRIVRERRQQLRHIGTLHIIRDWPPLASATSRNGL